MSARAAIAGSKFIGNVEGYMSTEWGEIPRDPMADDNELEYLYQRAMMQKPADACTNVPNNPATNPEQRDTGKKLPPASDRQWQVKKRA